MTSETIHQRRAAEKRLFMLGRKVLNAQNPHEMKKYAKLMLDEAAADVEIVSKVEHTTDPHVIARVFLETLTQDSMPIMDPSSRPDPDDPYYQRLELYRQRLPMAEQILAEQVRSE